MAFAPANRPRTDNDVRQQENNRTRRENTNERFVWWRRKTRREQVQRENYREKEREKEEEGRGEGGGAGLGEPLSVAKKRETGARIQTVLS